jgi:hypothetical protein
MFELDGRLPPTTPSLLGADCADVVDDDDDAIVDVIGV